ncbi:MAG: hypothetical protein EU529_09600 [Promethearchaeota archaeon]|nr:MAG: hypothetical protein EU529_09600 [Candidatus Lokiarchaeota archaeon]
MTKARTYKILLLIIVVSGLVPLLLLYFLYLREIQQAITHTEGAWPVVIIILIRIGFISVMSYYMFHRWFKQEEQYLSDIPFLFGIFLLLLAFGKILDLFWDLTFFTFNDDFVMFLLKIRFFIIILEMAPLIFLSINMILYLRSLRGKSTGDEKQRNKITLRIMLLIVAIETTAVILAPTLIIMGILLPCIVIPSILVIIWMFLFAYKNKRLSQVHPLIIAIGFIAWFISNIARVVLQIIFGETPTYIFTAEMIDFFVFLIIFLGFCLKANYSQE